jgi:hypothetical protein
MRRWLLRPAPAAHLAVFRILTHGWLLWYLGKRWRLLARTAAGSRRDFKPVGVARPLQEPLPVPAAKGLTAATIATTAMAGLGIGHRVTGPLNAALVWWTLTYRNSWSMVFHNDNLVVLHALLLGLSPSADALSVDAVRARGRRRRGIARGRRHGAPATSWAYGWPLQAAQAVTALAYLMAGIAKLRGPLGWRWASGEHLRSQVAVDGARKAVLRPDEQGTLPSAVMALERRPWMWTVFAAGSLALELGAPLALIHPTLGRLWAGSVWAMHVGIRQIMRITFRHQLSGVPYVPFVLAPGATRPWPGVPSIR